MDDLGLGAETAVAGQESGEVAEEDMGVGRRIQEGMEAVWKVWEVEGPITIITMIGCLVEVVEKAWE